MALASVRGIGARLVLGAWLSIGLSACGEGAPAEEAGGTGGRGATAGVDCDNKPAVTALREIAAGLVKFREDVKNTVTEFIVERRKAGFM